MPLLQLPGLLILTRFSNLSTGLRYRSASNTKLFLPLIRFYSLLVHITFAISLPSSLHDPLSRHHWSLSFTHKFSRVSKSLTTLFGMRHLTYGTNFLHLFAFLVSRPPQSALLHHQALTLLLNRWLACLTGSCILVLKLTFSPDPFPVTFLSLSLTDWFHGFIPHVYGRSLWRWKHWSVRQIKPALLAFGRTLI